MSTGSYAIPLGKRVSLLCYGVILLLIMPLINVPLTAAGQEEPPANPFKIPEDNNPPAIRDSGLRLETVVSGLTRPVAMSFIGRDDILVLEKDNGTVRRIVDGELQEEPVLDVAVANDNQTNERGLLGMAVAKPYVFLYYTESGGGQDGDDAKGVVPAGNRLYRYDLVERDDGRTVKLENPKLILDLPARPGPRYNAGPILVSQGNATGSATSVYLMIGDLDHHRSQAENYKNGPPPDGTGGIMRVDIEGKPMTNPALVDSNNSDSAGMLPYYFAYGIRNGFGMDFDPVTGNIWDTENGPNNYDEINLVQAGFNSGWAKIQGPITAETNSGVNINDDLEDFGGKGKYRDPEFSWNNTIGVTAIKFLNSDKLGREYRNDIFVGDINNGRIYHFDLNQGRTGLALDGVLSDKVADNVGELDNVIFGTGFRSISDIEVGPDGYLYVLTYGPGKIFRIAPEDADT
ncbi:MAG: PQQ-dependent sugar dehydrogenase [Thermoproteota archaeon]|nr:PQQ-dependent sugar dehydrogenase [Thermoproteota archaeon]